MFSWLAFPGAKRGETGMIMVVESTKAHQSGPSLQNDLPRRALVLGVGAETRA